METCEYQEVKSKSGVITKNNLNWKTILRQIIRSRYVYFIFISFQMLVCSGVWSNNFLFGLSAGTPPVAIAQVRKEANTTDAVTEEMASWISSGFGISGLVWLVLVSLLAARLGRRRSFLILCLNSLVGFIVLYFSKNALQILIGVFIHGASRSGMYILSPIIVTEYSSPSFRGLFSTLDSASFFWGVWIANAIGTFAHWKNIAILGVLCSLYAMTATFWPESPHWLASKGRFDECTAAHRWLKGSSRRSEDELSSLVSSQSYELAEAARLKTITRESFYRRIVVVTIKDKLYKPFLLALLIELLFIFSGKTITTMYALDIIKGITNSTNASYTGMLILDGLTVFCAYLGCGLAKSIRRRTLLFTASIISIIFMLMISLNLYLIKSDIISENTILSLLLLSGYSLAISCGPMILTTAIISELMPLKYRSAMYLSLSLIGMLIVTILLKMTLFIFRTIDFHGTFLLCAFLSMFILILLYKYLPETKDKTLQEIEEHFKNN